MVTLGQATDPKALCCKINLDLSTLVVTKLLIQANSGGGKSWVIRRILEQTFGKIQHIVLDLEGEFSSLREKFDYVLAGRGGDTEAHPRSAKLLARRLLELQASCITDLSELRFHERLEFVRIFLESLVDSPKHLWHPALVIVDEAHIFCPEGKKNESADAVIDLATRGRKRGFCAVLATQRLSKLHKDAAAELNNKLIGRTGLDVDMKRAADDLGFIGKEQMLSLRSLAPGEWFAFGPAISRSVVRLKVGDVLTRHPRVGEQRIVAPPPPTEKIKKLLAKIQDLPKEAEQEAHDVEYLRAEVRRYKHELATALTAAKAAAPLPPPAKIHTVKIPVLGKGDASRFHKDVEWLAKIADRMAQAQQTVVSELGNFKTAFSAVLDAVAESEKEKKKPGPTGGYFGPGLDEVGRKMRVFNRSVVRPAVDQIARTTKPPAAGAVVGPHVLGRCEIAILQTLAAHGPCDMGKMALLSGYRITGGLRNSISKLRSVGLLDGPNSGEMRATDAGAEKAGSPSLPNPGQELIRYWARHPSLGACESSVFKVLVESYPGGLTLQRLAEESGYQLSGGFRNAVSRLRTAGLLLGRNSESMTANHHLFG